MMIVGPGSTSNGLRDAPPHPQKRNRAPDTMKSTGPLLEKFLPLLLVVSVAVILINDRLMPRATPAVHEHGGHDDHDDPENNRRMGIFHYNEGNRDFTRGDLDSAVKNYTMALRHNDRFVEAYINLSTTYMREKRFALAGETLDRLETFAGKNPLLHYNRACLHSLAGDTEASLNALKEAVGLGFSDRAQIASDPDLLELRKDARFKSWFEAL